MLVKGAPGVWNMECFVSQNSDVCCDITKGMVHAILLSGTELYPGAHFTKKIPPQFKSDETFTFALFHILMDRSPQMFAHDTTAELLGMCKNWRDIIAKDAFTMKRLFYRIWIEMERC